VDFYIALRQRFVNPNDNGLVVEVALQKINNPEKLSVIHITQDEVLSKRDEGLGIYESRLESTNSPGDSQEAEIARLLTKIYSPDSVFVNPSLENKGEFCDVLVIGNVDAVAIQAKSTIRSEARFSESKERRQSRLTKHFKTALKQARRSERLFYGLNKTVTFDGSLVGLTPRSTLLFHLIVLYEKDAELLEAWSEELASFSTENTPVVVLDFAEFVCMLNVYKSRDVFIAALLTLANSFQKRKKIQEYDFFRDRVAGFGQ
jgi:hypothetical protein